LTSLSLGDSDSQRTTAAACPPRPCTRSGVFLCAPASLGTMATAAADTHCGGHASTATPRTIGTIADPRHTDSGGKGKGTVGVIAFYHPGKVRDFLCPFPSGPVDYSLCMATMLIAHATQAVFKLAVGVAAVHDFVSTSCAAEQCRDAHATQTVFKLAVGVAAAHDFVSTSCAAEQCRSPSVLGTHSTVSEPKPALIAPCCSSQ
jgi:hypothetical protein